MKRIMISQIESCSQCCNFVCTPDCDGAPYECLERELKSCPVKGEKSDKKACEQTKKWFKTCKVWAKVEGV